MRYLSSPAVTITSTFDHSQPRLFSRPDRIKEPLYVVAPVINSARFRSRWKHYEDFEKHVADSGAILYTVEVAFGDREFAVTHPDNPHHLQLRTKHELWLKEQAINLCVARLPADWKYLAWIDADCLFARHDWADEARHLLQHYPIIQMWSQLQDLDRDYQVIQTFESFVGVQTDDGPKPPVGQYQAPVKRQRWGCTGLAWAIRREAWNQLGGLIDYCILGAGDWYFANAVMGTLDKAIDWRNDTSAPFLAKMRAYAERASGQWEERPIRGNIGLMKGLVLHYWHGPRSGRQYETRGRILAKYAYDPDRDLKPDWQGLYQLTDRCPGMRREIQRYFAQRNDDG